MVYRNVDEALADRRRGTKLSEVVENILHSPYVLEQIETPFDLIQGLHSGDYLDASTNAWGQLSVELQIKYSSAYQLWYAYHLGCKSIEGTFDLVPGVETQMMLIPPMKYLRGPAPTFKKAIVETLITDASWLGKYEVTQFEWQAVMHYNPSYFLGNDRPVERVAYGDCQEFCNKTGMRLPDDKLWEMACRAGTTTLFSFGDDIERLEYYGWHAQNAESRTHPVGELKANAFGLYDMHGNVSEWCENKITRGGSWRTFANVCHSTFYISRDSAHSFNYLGLRLFRPLLEFGRS